MTQEATPATAAAAPPVSADLKPNQVMCETNSAVGLPGDTAQLFFRFADAVTLDGMVVDEGGQLLKIIAGSHNIGPEPDGSFKFGQSIQAGVYCTAIVKNVTGDAKALKGAFMVTPAAPGAAAAPAPGSLTSPHAHNPNVHMPSPFAGAASPRAPSGGSPTVTPGSNEVAILLSYMDAKRILNVITGAEMAIHISESEKAGMTRAFHHAFQRSGMGG